MGCCTGLSRHRASPSSSVMLRRLRRLRVTAIFYTCGGLCAILLLVNFNEDVKRLLQQSSYSNGPHLSPSSHSLLQTPQQMQQFITSQILPGSQQAQEQLALSNSVNGRVSNFQKPFDEFTNNLIIENSPNSQNVGGETGGTSYKKIDSQSTVESGSGDVATLNENESQPEKPWYMWGGTKFPSLSSGVPSASVDEARLWYEDNLNNDRIIDQLIFWINDPVNNPNASWWVEGGETVTLSTSTSGKEESSGGGFVGVGDISRSSSSGGGGERSESRKTTLDDGFLSNVALSTGSVQLTSRLLRQNDSFVRGSGGLGLTGSGQRRDKLKTILLYYGLGMSWGSHIISGRSVFLQQKCPVNACRLTGNRAQLAKSDVVLFKDVFMNPKVRRIPSQLWVMYMLECPLNTQNFADKNVFNLTATYRHDSDIVTPYEKWVYYDENVKTLAQGVNYAEGKTKKVAWFVSNCVAKNNRLDYARELSKYIEVDIFGACGTHSCSRANSKQCFDLLAKNYKFYLAFENSNCRDYISEKFFVNGLGNNVLPIVMGAHPDDYKRVAPAKSYIHVDDFATPKELAEYLYLLDANNDLYNEYFQWKGTGEFINTHFFCRLCAMAHYADKSERKPRHYKDFNRWWRGPQVCTRRSWRGQPDIFSPENYERQTVDN